MLVTPLNEHRRILDLSPQNGADHRVISQSATSYCLSQPIGIALLNNNQLCTPNKEDDYYYVEKACEKRGVKVFILKILGVIKLSRSKNLSYIKRHIVNKLPVTSATTLKYLI